MSATNHIKTQLTSWCLPEYVKRTWSPSCFVNLAHMQVVNCSSFAKPVLYWTIASWSMAYLSTAQEFCNDKKIDKARRREKDLSFVFFSSLSCRTFFFFNLRHSHTRFCWMNSASSQQNYSTDEWRCGLNFARQVDSRDLRSFVRQCMLQDAQLASNNSLGLKARSSLSWNKFAFF